MRWLVMFLCLGSLARAEELPWIVARDDGRDKVVYRDHEDRNAREIQAITNIAAPPERVWAVLQDIEHYTEFMPYLVEARTLGVCPDGSLFYERIDPPIISARDYTICVHLDIDEKTSHFARRWTLANDLGPAPRDGTIRVAVNEGSWALEPDGHGGTHVTYTLLTHPGGSIPMWIAKRASTNSVPDLLDAIRKRSLDPHWKR